MEKESWIFSIWCSIVTFKYFVVILSTTFVLSLSAQDSAGIAAGEDCSPCSSPLSTLHQKIIEDLFPNGYEVYINCLVFDENGRLEQGIASGYGKSGTNQSIRMIVSCQEGVLSGVESEVATDMSDIRNQEYSACLECVDSVDCCRTPCDVSCEKCFGDSKQCTECTRYRLLNSYSVSDDHNDGAAMEAKCTTDKANYSTGFQCVHNCPDNGNHSAPNEIHQNTCFACGLEYCVECEPNSTEGERGQSWPTCTSCLANTVLYKGQCYACPLADVARVAMKQEEEKRAENSGLKKKHTTLAVVLIVVLSLVIAAFVQMSIYAHMVYGKTRLCHKKQNVKKKQHTVLHRM